MSRYQEESEHFDFDAGAKVRVRIREKGKIVAKFDADVEGFQPRPIGTERVSLDPPWRCVGGVKLQYYDADFEVLEE